MSVQDTDQRLWGGETTKAVANFPVSGERAPVAAVRQLGLVKGAAARANADLGPLDADVAQRIAAGAHDAQFPVDDATLDQALDLRKIAAGSSA